MLVAGNENQNSHIHIPKAVVFRGVADATPFVSVEHKRFESRARLFTCPARQVHPPSQLGFDLSSLIVGIINNTSAS